MTDNNNHKPKPLGVAEFQAAIRKEAQTRIISGTPIDFELMVSFGILLEDAVKAILEGKDALDPLVKISVVAAYLHRADVTGKVIPIL